MIKKCLIFFGIITGLALGISLAARAIVIDLSEKKIEIRYSFEGADIILFGAVGETPIDPLGEPFDVVIVVRGPTAPAVVRRKEKVGGLIWANSGSANFPSVPGYYAVAANRPLKNIAANDVYAQTAIGFENLPLELSDTGMPDTMKAGFQKALYRLRTANGLYREELDSVTIVGEGLFRTDVRLPSNVPVGDFIVEAYVFQNGELVAEDKIDLTVDKAGFERAVYNFAHDTPFLYGIIAVIVALSSGWFAGVVGKK